MTEGERFLRFFLKQKMKKNLILFSIVQIKNSFLNF